MAFIGMRHVVACELDSHTDGSEPTYKTSGGFDVGGAISANLTKNKNANGALYYDDALGESDDGLISLDLDIGLDDILEDVQEKMGLLEKTTAGSPSVTTYYETSKNPKALGIGYMRVRRKNGVTSYQGIWVYKMQFSINNETANTKGESIEWQTPTINGKGFGLAIDSSGELTFRKFRLFQSAADAATWLDGLANISRSSG